MPINNNGSTFAGAGYLFACGLGSVIASASTITVSDGVHVVTGSAAISTINGGQRNPNVCYLIKDSGATWSFTSGGNIINTGTLPYTPPPSAVTTLLWDGSAWRIAAAGQIGYVGNSATAYGDSIMLGVGLATTAGIVPTIAAATGWSITNAAVSGSTIADAGQSDVIFASSINAGSQSLLLSGYNDMRLGGTSAASLATYRGAAAALAAWLAIPDANKLRGTSSSIAYTGSWTAATAYGGNLVKTTTTNGDTAVASVQGSVVYVGAVKLIPSTGGTFSVAVDGVTYGSFSCNDMAALTPAGRNFAPFLVRVAGLPSTKHTVTITNTSAGQIYIAYVAGNGLQAPNQPSLLVGNCLRMNATGYTLGAPFNQGSNAAAGLYAAALRSAVDPLIADGLNITLLDTSAVYNPDTAANIQTDNIHPSATGAALIAQPYIWAATATARATDHNAPIVRPTVLSRAVLTSASQTINSATPAALAGATKTFVAPFDGTAVITADLDAQQTGAGLLIVDLYSGGVATTTSGRIGFDPGVVNARASLSHTWQLSITAGTSYTYALYAATAGAGSFDIYGVQAGNPNTGFVVALYPTT